MKYRLLINPLGQVNGYVADEAGDHTEEQARAAMIAGKPFPTDEELDSAVQQLASENAAREYKRKRALEYPDFLEYLDGVVKGDQAQIDKYISECLAVKAKYPKPE
jgi:hypothetical protein